MRQCRFDEGTTTEERDRMPHVIVSSRWTVCGTHLSQPPRRSIVEAFSAVAIQEAIRAYGPDLDVQLQAVA